MEGVGLAVRNACPVEGVEASAELSPGVVAFPKKRAVASRRRAASAGGDVGDGVGALGAVAAGEGEAVVPVVAVDEPVRVPSVALPGAVVDGRADGVARGGVQGAARAGSRVGEGAGERSGEGVQAVSAFALWAQGAGALEEFVGCVLDGGHMADFCRERGFAYTAMFDWVRADARRAQVYAHAREDRAERFVDEIVAISDEAAVKVKHQGEEVLLSLDATAVSRNKLRVDARKWIAAKLKPRVYGERAQGEAAVEHKGVPDEVLLARLAKLGVVLPGIAPRAPTEAADE